MTAKHIVHTFTVLLTLGMVAFFVAPAAQTDSDAWEIWIDEQTDAALRSAGGIGETQRSEMRASLRAKFSALAAELKKEIDSPPQMQDYAIFQTIKELRDTYDEGYDRKHKDTSVRVSYTTGGTEIFAYDESIPLAEVDAKYPRDTWIQMLLDKGITIKNADAYWEYLFLRDTLVHIERQPEVWASGLFGIPATEDWGTYKAAYIEQKLGQVQKRLKGKDKRVIIFDDLSGKHHFQLEKSLEFDEVFKELPYFSKEFSWQAFKGLQTVKALRDAYDKKYNERYATTSASFSWNRDDGSTIFAYKVPLPMSEVDTKYPRDEWLQMLLDKGISISNFEAYWAYLSNRDTLVALENQPDAWTSGFFGIPPTEDWETYKAAYLKQMIEKPHFNQGTVYFGKAAAAEALEKAEKGLEDVKKRIKEQFQRPFQRPPLEL